MFKISLLRHCILTSAQSGRSYWISPQFEVNILVLFLVFFMSVQTESVCRLFRLLKKM